MASAAAPGRSGRLASLNVSAGGVPKRPVAEAWLGPLGLAGDVQRNKKHHGGPERAVCLYSADVIAMLQQEGHPIEAGSTGENMTVTELDWALVVPGARLQIGDAVQLEITRYTVPCTTIKRSFAAGKFQRILQEKHPGVSRVYARVLHEGLVRSGDPIHFVDGASD